MAARKAASVLPEPVGAAIRTLLPAWISGQARVCGSVGAAKFLRHQRSTAGGNVAGFLTGDREDWRRLRDYKIGERRKSAIATFTDADFAARAS